MAERRMFAKTIILSDAFLDMPMSARCLYFTLGMLADDDGFVNSPKSIMRQCGASQDDMNVLISKKFVLVFESGVVVIKHWRIHNYLRNDRYNETKYIEEKSLLTIEENGTYSLNSEAVYQMDTNGIPDGNQRYPQDRLGKDSIGKVRLGKDKSAKAPAVYYPEDEALNKAFTDYVAMRKAIKAPMTEKAIELAISKLQKLSNGDNDVAIEILNQSVLNSWKGLFELKSSSPKKQDGGINWDEV